MQRLHDRPAQGLIQTDPLPGVLVVVEKSRRLLLWQSVRIHLDDVRGLGSFIEIEAVAGPASDLTSERRQAREVQEALAIAPEQIMAISYSDELLRSACKPREHL
jgi:predicted adenylyl cyclase CyaB